MVLQDKFQNQLPKTWDKKKKALYLLFQLSTVKTSIKQVIIYVFSGISVQQKVTYKEISRAT